MALLGAFVGEFIASRTGLGHLIVVAEGLYNVNLIWVGIFGIVGLAMAFLAITTPVERWARRWKT
jgi:NitT/TauT family transport system permease protein